ncbi:MAG: radical SAM protein [Candidatus Pacebacteria bacterium]|nr:radical SAM protein [Candidatus Paceibacterota bacterium]
MKKVYIETNGCSVVRHDTQRYSKYFRVNGWKEIYLPEEADLVLLTTCAVVKDTEDSSVLAIKNLRKNMKKGAQLIVGGCLSKINPERLSKEFNGICFGKDEEEKLDDLIDAKIKIMDIFWDGNIIREHSLGVPELVYSNEHIKECKLAEGLADKFKNSNYLEIYNYMTKGRYMWQEKDLFEVKVSDGCNYRCSYCATKNAKGDLKSRNINKIIAEFKLGVEKGYPKIVLTGDEVGEYGKDIGLSLVDLIERLVPISGNSRIALRYITPESIIKQYEKLKGYFHSGKIYYFCSSFQSGSSKILKLMNRPQNINDFVSLMNKMTNDCSYVFKHTQIIIGFPQETEKDFNQTLEVINNNCFEYVTALKYSVRPHTKAVDIPGHISQKIIDERYEKAIKLISKLRKEKLKNKIYDELLRQFSA